MLFARRSVAGAATQVIAVILILVLFNFSIAVASATTRLPNDEVDTLTQVAKTLGKTNWDFRVDPCSGQSGWTTPFPQKGFENNLTCNCTFNNNSLCHIVSIVLKGQNLSGELPSELAKLPYIQQIDLTRNYLNGTLPPEWGSTQLLNISLGLNRLTGSIPKEYANITTLEGLVLESNQLSGAIPPDLGNLTAIQRIILSSNNFTGELPETLGKLTTLQDFRISDNHFAGKIPNFIQKWTNLEKLAIQSSGLDGPIPSGIAPLTNLTDLRISDLNGIEATFPTLSGMKNLKTLILRSCNIVGQLPDYIIDMKKLKVLDLSFNKLSGPIPNSYSRLSDIDIEHIYLTRNLLSGSVPAWMEGKRIDIDLSYNNFTLGSLGARPCGNVNLFRITSKRNNTSENDPCLGSFSCSRNFSSFHINCGGSEVVPDDGINTKYEADIEQGGPSTFVQGVTNWAFSSTGNFLDDDTPTDSYTRTSTSSLYGNQIQSRLYMDARISPLSLTYYGFCLLNGNYTVKLHFAEIIFTDDKTYSSLGRRIFDVYIQGIRVLKDFNIEVAAGGVRKETIQNFSAVVNGSTLEIRFHWAGKGTTSVPSKGVYGPLISAISVNSDSVRPSGKGDSVDVGTVVGIVAAVVSAIVLVLFILWWKGCLQNKERTELDLRGLDLYTGSFTLRQIIAATDNFDDTNKIGEGGFGPVYKGVLPDGTIIAVKQLSSKSKQGNREFVNEIGMISAVQHPHLVKLYGCCIEANQLLLVYEYMENNSLARALFGPEDYYLKLDWATRHKICIGIARGLAYLHEESRVKIVHRDIKATNVLLDKDLNPKISDFGLAKLDEEENTHISTRIAGTFGYMAPEYAMRGYLTDKADVYSFGIITLEIVSGRSNSCSRPQHESFYLLDWALALKDKGSLLDLVDERLGSEYNEEEVMVMLNVGLACANVSPAARPAMSSVVSILEGRAVLEEVVLDSIVQTGMMKPPRRHQSYATSSGDWQVQNVSTNESWTASSTSTADLYPLNLDSEYLKLRS